MSESSVLAAMTRRRGIHGNIDKTSSVPYYRQLHGLLLASIRSGALGTGDLLPSEAELSRQFDISRTVIRKALDVLDREGRIRRMKGRRTAVAEPVAWDFQPELTGLPALPVFALRDLRLLGFADAEPTTCAELKADPPLRVVIFEYRVDDGSARRNGAYTVRLQVRADASPLLRAAAEKGVAPQPEAGSLTTAHRLLSGLGVRLSHSLVTVRPALATGEVAAAYGIAEGAPILHFRSVGVDTGGRPVALSEAYGPPEPGAFRLIVRYES